MSQQYFFNCPVLRNRFSAFCLLFESNDKIRDCFFWCVHHFRDKQEGQRKLGLLSSSSVARKIRVTLVYYSRRDTEEVNYTQGRRWRRENWETISIPIKRFVEMSKDKPKLKLKKKSSLRMEIQKSSFFCFGLSRLRWTFAIVWFIAYLRENWSKLAKTVQYYVNEDWSGANINVNALWTDWLILTTYSWLDGMLYPCVRKSSRHCDWMKKILYEFVMRSILSKISVTVWNKLLYSELPANLSCPNLKIYSLSFSLEILFFPKLSLIFQVLHKLLKGWQIKASRCFSMYMLFLDKRGQIVFSFKWI